MKLLPAQTDKFTLSDVGMEAAALLKRHDYSALVRRFGYARAFDRDPATAIENDYLIASASPVQTPLEEQASVTVRYFQPNCTGLFAVVECIVPVTERAAVLLELIVTGDEEYKHITVEDISGDTI